MVLPTPSQDFAISSPMLVMLGELLQLLCAQPPWYHLPFRGCRIECSLRESGPWH